MLNSFELHDDNFKVKKGEMCDQCILPQSQLDSSNSFLDLFTCVYCRKKFHGKCLQFTLPLINTKLKWLGDDKFLCIKCFISQSIPFYSDLQYIKYIPIQNNVCLVQTKFDLSEEIIWKIKIEQYEIL